MRASLATRHRAHAGQKTGSRLGTSLIAASHCREVFPKGSAEASRGGATTAPRLDRENHRAARTGQTMDAARKPAVSRLSAGLACGTRGAQPGRDEGDRELVARLLDRLHQEIRKAGKEVSPGHANTPLRYAETIEASTLAYKLAWQEQATSTTIEQDPLDKMLLANPFR